MISIPTNSAIGNSIYRLVKEEYMPLKCIFSHNVLNVFKRQFIEKYQVTLVCIYTGMSMQLRSDRDKTERYQQESFRLLTRKN